MVLIDRMVERLSMRERGDDVKERWGRDHLNQDTRPVDGDKSAQSSCGSQAAAGNLSGRWPRLVDMDFGRGSKPRTTLLRVEGVVNLVFGVVLMAFPSSLFEPLGVPSSEERFYPTVLGAVLFGIGVALLIESNRLPGGIIGLGLGGAIAVNLAAASVLFVWLIWGDLDIPTRGRVLLGLLSAGLVAISSFELWARWNRRP